MPIEKHDLAHEFPQYRERIHELKMNNQHFSNLFREYHDIDHEVRRIEIGAEISSDSYLEERKKRRLLLKDELYALLRAGEERA
ncbi:MAG TPA: DUF465 domain-containing protein [Gammaproteobacteria bacterium]|nr:DUF465 domain-containing protein [Gammaproteobacteria bacterium]